MSESISNPIPTAVLYLWHPTKNMDLLPTNFSRGSGKKVWWECALGHAWESAVSSVSKGHGCPYCSNNKILAGYNDLGTLQPALAKEWHPTLNGSLTPSMVASQANRKVWWKGLGKDCGHEWDAKIANRVAGASGCPYCAGKKILSGFNDLTTTNSKLASEWHPTKNGDTLPHHVSAGSHKKAWWVCPIGHEWEGSIEGRNAGNNCHYCSSNKILTGFNDLSTVYPQAAISWHPAKNDKTPDTIMAHSNQRAWWICTEGHEWDSTINIRVKYLESKFKGCPVCSGNKVLKGYNDLATVAPELLKEWDYTKNVLLPTEITSGSNQKAWWVCQAAKHSWEVGIGERKKYGCLECAQINAGKVKATPKNGSDLATLFPQLALEWHPTKNGSLLPNHVNAGTARRVWWLCDKGHEWFSQINGRKDSNYGCPKCSYRISKAEQEIVDFLQPYAKDLEQSNRSIIGKELDIYIPSKKVAIEYNGVYWHTENQGKDKTYHQAKYLACKALGIQLIQIWEDEWNRNPEQIKAMLLHKLGITQQDKVFARKTVTTQLKKAEIEAFLEQHHVQGYAAGSYYLGLREKSTDELVSVLVLKKEANNTLNIIRYATSKNVVGGFTKLLRYAELAYKPSRFITFSDHCVSDGGLYANNGFIADKELSPDYRYVVNGERQHKFGYRLKRFRDDPNLQWDESMTERELAALNGLPRIWDAGKTRWVFVVHHQN